MQNNVGGERQVCGDKHLSEGVTLPASTTYTFLLEKKIGQQKQFLKEELKIQ